MFWLVPALLSRFCYSLCNVLDSHFCHGHFKSAFGQNAVGSLCHLFALPFVFLIFHPSLSPAEAWPWIIATGVIQRLYLIPYFSALRWADASSITALYTLGRAFVPVLAFFMIGETMNAREWIGFAIVLAGALYLCLSKGTHRVPLKPFLLMMLSSLGLALFVTCSKRAFDDTSFADSYPYVLLASIVTTGAICLLPQLRKEIGEDLVQFRQVWRFFVINSFSGLVANALFYYAVSLTKASYVAMTAQFGAFFVLLIMFVMQRFSILKTRERMDWPTLRPKIAAFLVMAAGMMLSLWHA